MLPCKKWGKNYVVKHYHGGWKPSGKIKDFLSNVRHPNIAHVLEMGFMVNVIMKYMNIIQTAHWERPGLFQLIIFKM